MATNYDFGIGQKITSQDVDLQSVIGAGEGFRPEESVSKLTGEKVGPKYPALEPLGEVDYEFDKLQLFGIEKYIPFGSEIETLKSREREVEDYTKLTPLVKTSNFYDLMGSKDDAEMLNAATGVMNKKGEIFSFPGKDLKEKTNLSLDQKLAYADRVQGVSFIEQWGDNESDRVEHRIPFEDALVNELQLPEDIIGKGIPIPNWLYTPVKDDILNPDGKTPYEMYHDSGFDSNLTKIFYSRQLNKNLIKQGIKDPRTRLGIIRDQKSFGAALSFMATDLDKIGGSLREGLKFPIQMATWLGAEATQALFGMDEEGNFLKSSERHKFYEKYVPEMAVVIQDRLAQNNISLTYEEASLMARNYSGMGTAVLGVAAEIAVPTGLAMRVKGAFGKDAQKRFDEYYNNIKGPNGTRKKASDETIFNEFINIESQKNLALTSPLLVANVFNYTKFVPVIGKPIAGLAGKIERGRVAINRFIVTNRSIAGTQMKDAAQLLPENRSEVQALMNMYNTQLSRRQALINKVKKQDGDIDLDPAIKELDDEIFATVKEIQKTAAISKMPRFMREANAQNANMIIGGAVGNQIAQQYGFDPALGEVGGLFTGLIGVFAFKKGGSGLNWVKDNLMNKANVSGNVFDFADELAKKMNTFTPEFAQAVRNRMVYYDNLRDTLEAAGVPRELLNTSFAKMSGLSFLQILEEGSRLNIKAKSLVDFNKLEELQGNADMQLQLVNELRSAITAMEGVEGVTNQQASMNLLKMMKATLDDAESSVKQLNLDIKTISTFGKDRITDFVLGKVKGKGLLDATTTETVDTALINVGINEARLIPKSEVTQINNSFNKSHTDVSDVVTKQANILLGQGKFETALTKTQVATGKDNVSFFDSSGKLTSLLIESKYASRHNIAGTNYRLLDNASFVTKDNKFVGGDAYVDGGNALFDLIDSVGIYKDDYAISLLNSAKGISSGQQTKLFNVFDDIIENFITDVAKNKNLEVADMKQQLVDAMKANGTYNKKVSANINIAKQLRDTAPDGTSVQSVKMSFNQLKEFRSALSHLSYKAKQSANDVAARDYDSLSTMLEKQMDNFVVNTANGPVPVGSLFVKREGKLVSANQVLQDAKNDWSQFKDHFFSGEISKWMGKGKGGLRKKTAINKDNPMGVKYGTKPDEWLNIKSFIGKTPEQLKGIFQDIQNGLGDLQTAKNQSDITLHGTYRLDPKSQNGKAFGAILDNVVANFLADKIKKSGGKITLAEVQKDLDKLQVMFMGTTKDGKPATLINVKKVFDEKFAFNAKNIGEEAFNKQMSQADSAIKRNEIRLIAQGETVRDGIIAAKSLLAKYDPENVAKGNLTDILFENGGVRVDSFKKSLNTIRRQSGKPDFTSDEIDQVLTALLNDTIDNLVFVPTGNFTAVKKKSSGVYTDPDLIMETDLDLDRMKNLIGYGDETKSKVIEGIVGEKRYKVYKAIIEMAAANKLRGAENVNLTGVPRAFSLESYISRFYSINRGVISARYVGTEAILQQMRLRNMSTMKAMLSNPDAAELFMKSVRSGKPLTAIEEEAFFNALAVGVAYVSTHHEKLNKVTISNNIQVYQSGNVGITSDEYPEYRNMFGKARPKIDNTKALNEAIKKQQRLPFPLGTNKSLDANKPPQ